MTRRFGLALLSAQIIAPNAYESLESLDDRPITRSGRRAVAACATRHPNASHLAKVGLEGDQTIDAEAVAETTSRLRRQRDKNNLRSKIRRYILAPDRHKVARIAGFISSRLRARLAPPFGAPTPCSDKAWGLVPGVNFRRDEDGLWRCSDHGAIYETYLTSRAVRFPSQVGADLYTNSCAAAVFHHLARRPRASAAEQAKWTQALRDMADYLAALRRQPRQRLESDHREFDFGPIFLALGPEAAAPWAGWSNYDPVNVYGLRYFNESLLAQAASPQDKPAIERRIALILRVLEKNQTPHGLLQDNFSGNTVDSTDLTYHQYALAMLCLGNARRKDPRADAIIARALTYSVDQTLATGEPSYYGRGANNVYHAASFACALCYGIARLALPLESTLERVAKRLEAYQDAEGWWPTALNRVDYAEMMGWHGSNAQYGALSAFLLAQGAALLAEDDHDEEEPRRAASGATAAADSDRGAALRHCVLRRGAVELALTSGGGHIPWSQGLHVSGYAGITALALEERNLWLTNDALTLWGQPPLLIADLRHQTPQDRRRLRRSETSPEAILEISGPKMNGAAQYSAREDGFAVEIEHAFSPAEHTLALLGDCRVEQASPSELTIFSSAGFMAHVETSHPVTFETIAVPVNPQGPGTLIRLIGKQPNLEIAYRLALGADH